MTTDTQRLAGWRTIGARHSEEVVDIAPRVLKSERLGDQEWAIREQLCIAALDLGNLKIATEQLALLQKRFAGSPRVALLGGLRCEARGDLAGAKRTYEDLLKTDETNVTAHQRLIALSLPSPLTTIPLLLSYLDTFYTDPAGWSLLAELYADQGLYAQSLTALGHVMVIQSWDTGAVVRAAETAYTLGDYQLALKYFLRGIEMQTDPNRPKEGKKTRAWWGLKLTITKLLANPTSETSIPPEQVSSPAQLKSLDELATERLLIIGGAGLGAVRTVLSADTKPLVR